MEISRWRSTLAVVMTFTHCVYNEDSNQKEMKHVKFAHENGLRLVTDHGVQTKHL